MRVEDLIAKRFDDLAGQFPSEIDFADARLKAIINHIQEMDGKRILEVGCGKGRVSKVFKNRGANVFGIDISGQLLLSASKIRPFHFIKAEAYSVPFKDNAFDCVVLLEVIEHIPNLAQVFKELARVLKKEGSLIVVDRNKFSLNNRRFLVPNLIVKRYHELKNEWMYPKDFPYRERWFNPRKIFKYFKNYFSKAGYEYVISDGEKKKWWHFIFKLIPQIRHFVLWYGTDKYN